MCSKKQNLANRKNALKSTGPRTLVGQATSSKNSLKHGLLAQQLIIRDESPSELEILQTNLYNSLQPIDSVEELLVEKIIKAAWRMQRVLQIEKEFLQKKDYSGWEKLNQAFKGYDGNYLMNLFRYEAMLEKHFYKALHELQRIQGIRSGQPVLAPIAIDINSQD